MSSSSDEEEETPSPIQPMTELSSSDEDEEIVLPTTELPSNDEEEDKPESILPTSELSGEDDVKEKSSFKYPTTEPPSSDESSVFSIPPRGNTNVYEAVAGQVTKAGLIGRVTDPKAAKDSLRPDEVLFKQVNAPIRFEETDYYYAHANLPADEPLPGSDLLSAIHAYISKLYRRTEQPDSLSTWKFMDETALIAFGILLEEEARELLGATGDLAFTEAGDEIEDEDGSSNSWDEEWSDEETESEQLTSNDERAVVESSAEPTGYASLYPTDDSEEDREMQDSQEDREVRDSEYDGEREDSEEYGEREDPEEDQGMDNS